MAIATDEYEARGDSPLYGLPRLLLQITVQQLDAAGEAVSIMLARQRLNVERRCGSGHSSTGQLKASLCGRLEPSIRFPWMEECLCEGLGVGGVQPDRLSFLDDAHGRIMHTGDPEICQRAPLQLGSELE